MRDACAAQGVLCGLHCLTAEDAARYADSGFAMVTASHDLVYLRAGLADALGTARGS